MLKGSKHTQETKDKIGEGNHNHKPNCQCCSCKSKRGESSGKNHPMYGKDRPSHKPNCQCSFCKAQRGELSGENNPMYKKGYLKTGEKHPNWKGGKYQQADGRWIIWIDGIKYFRYRYVAMKCLGRKLTKEEVIHHINGDCSDDRQENLYLFSSQSYHNSQHKLKNSPILVSNLK